MANTGSSPEYENPFAVISHDVPQELVDQILSQLHNDEEAVKYTLPQWVDFTKDKPHIRESISRIAYDIAPDDIDLRQRVTQGILGFFAVIREGKIIEVLEHETELDIDTLSIEPTSALTDEPTPEPTENRKFRLIGNWRSNAKDRSERPKLRHIHHSIAAAFILSRFDESK